MPDGAGKVLVAIADVDALVKKRSALDDHARQNTTSVYTAGETFPMLPEKLSTDLTSLNYASDRLAIVVEMVLAGDGSLQSSDLRRKPLILSAFPIFLSASSNSWVRVNTASNFREAGSPGTSVLRSRTMRTPPPRTADTPI